MVEVEEDAVNACESPLRSASATCHEPTWPRLMRCVETATRERACCGNAAIAELTPSASGEALSTRRIGEEAWCS